MIKFFISWLSNCFNISVSDLSFCIGINEVHKSREGAARKFWSESLKAPPAQFNKTSFKKAVNKKVYENISDHYGSLQV